MPPPQGRVPCQTCRPAGRRVRLCLFMVSIESGKDFHNDSLYHLRAKSQADISGRRPQIVSAMLTPRKVYPAPMIRIAEKTISFLFCSFRMVRQRLGFDSRSPPQLSRRDSPNRVGRTLPHIRIGQSAVAGRPVCHGTIALHHDRCSRNLRRKPRRDSLYPYTGGSRNTAVIPNLVVGVVPHILDQSPQQTRTFRSLAARVPR